MLKKTALFLHDGFPNIYEHFAINPSCKGPAGLKALETEVSLKVEKDH